MTMFVRYIEEARLTIFRAKHEADRFGALEIAPEHILLALLSDPALIHGTMKGISEKEMRETIDAHLPRHEPNTLPHDLPLSETARRALVLAEGEADTLGHPKIRNQHLLLGLLKLVMRLRPCGICAVYFRTWSEYTACRSQAIALTI